MFTIADVLLSTPWISISVALLALIYLYLHLTRPPAIQLPGPRNYPWPLSLIAHFRAVRKANGNHLVQYELFKKHGKIFKALFSARSPTICIADPEMAKMIMVKHFHKFPNRGFPFDIPPPLDSELFLSKYPKWKRLRKVASPAFSAVKLKSTVDFVEDAADRLNAKLLKYSESGNASYQ